MGWGDVFGDIWGGLEEIGGLFTGETSFSDLGDNIAHNWNELVSGDEDSSLYDTFANPQDPFTALASSIGQATYLTGKGVIDAFDFTGDALGDVGKTVTGGVFDDAVYDIGGDLVAGGITSLNPKKIVDGTKGLLNLTDNLSVAPSTTAIRHAKPVASTFKIRAPYPAPSNVMGMNAPLNFKMGNFTLPNNRLTRAFTRDYKFGFPRTGKYSQYIPGRIALDGQRTFAPVKSWGAYEGLAFAPELADKVLFGDEYGDMWLPSYSKWRNEQNIEKEEQKVIEAENKALEQMNSEGIYTSDQLDDLYDMGNPVEGPQKFIDYIIPTEKDTVDVQNDNLFGD